MAFLDILGSLGPIASQALGAGARARLNAQQILAERTARAQMQQYRNALLKQQQGELEQRGVEADRKAAIERAQPFVEFWKDQDRVAQAQTEGWLDRMIDDTEKAFQAAGYPLNVGQFRSRQPSELEARGLLGMPAISPSSAGPELRGPAIQPPTAPFGMDQMPTPEGQLQAGPVGQADPAASLAALLRGKVSPVQFKPSLKTQQAGRGLDIREDVAAQMEAVRAGQAKVAEERAATEALLRDPRMKKLAADIAAQDARKGLIAAQTTTELGEPGRKERDVTTREKLAGIAAKKFVDTAQKWRTELRETVRNNKARTGVMQQVADIRQTLADLAVENNPLVQARLQAQANVLTATIDPLRKMKLGAQLKAALQTLRAPSGGERPISVEELNQTLTRIDGVLGPIESALDEEPTPTSTVPAPSAPAPRQALPRPTPRPAATIPAGAPTEEEVNVISRLIDQGT